MQLDGYLFIRNRLPRAALATVQLQVGLRARQARPRPPDARVVDALPTPPAFSRHPDPRFLATPHRSTPSPASPSPTPTPPTALNLVFTPNVRRSWRAELEATSLKATRVRAGRTIILAITLTSDAAKVHVLPPAPTAGGSIAQVAVKTNSGVFYFTDTIPLAGVPVMCQVAQQD